jgi:nucleotide-binding universal stress UspA family protein
MESNPPERPTRTNAAPSGAVFVATDLRGHADAAIVEGHERAAAEGRALIVCHVIQRSLHADVLLPGMTPLPLETPPVLRSTAAYRLRKRVARLTGRTDRQFEALIEIGTPDEMIVSAADRRRAALVIVGGHPPGRLEHLHGSVTDRVVRLAHVPVLVARRERKDGPVVAATDFSDPAIPAISAAAMEARRCGVRLILLHSLEPPVSGIDPIPVDLDGPWTGAEVTPMLELRRSALSRLEGIRDRLPFDGDLVVAEGSASEAILRASESSRASLIVVGSKGKTGWRRVLLGSVAESVVRRAGCSVLVVRLGSRAAPARGRQRTRA